MLAKKTKDKALRAIQSGDTTEAIQLLKAGEINDDQRRNLTLIEAEYNELQSAILKGIVSEDNRRSRRNQINDHLLTLLQNPRQEGPLRNRKTYSLVGWGIGITVLTFLLIYWLSTPVKTCPDFDTSANNQLLILPFEQVGSQAAKPHLLLRDRIETLVRENNLSTSVGLGLASPDLSANEAPVKALECEANAIVWGKYSASSDSIRLVLQYHFIDQPEAASVSELISLQDVTAIHSGRFSQSLDDAIFALCAVIALREGELELARKWIGEVKETEILGKELRQFLN
ncbi:hypothetical protein CEQ90_00530 [Lewinellaceae bacterium SD302]|nr:hypothetical protein CEQ90_00530 [Lewinellaceae bacterium SD302]